MKIGLCMENTEELEHIRFMIEEYLKIRSCGYELEAVCGTEKLKEAFGGRKPELLFLELSGEKAEQMAAALLEQEGGPKLALLSKGRKAEAFSLENQAFAVLDLEKLPEELPGMMDRFFWKEHYQKRERMILNTKGRQVVILMKELMYLERDKRLTTLALSDGSLENSSLELSVLQDMIGRDDFLRCHNSYVVNLNFVREFRRNEFCLFNGKDIPISRRYLDEVRRRFKVWADSIW